MPKNNESDLDLDSLLDEQLGSSDTSRPNINRASFLDPDHQAEVITLAESRNIDTQTVENNGWTQKEAAKQLGVTQPRVSVLLRGKIELFSLDMLVNMLAVMGNDVEIIVKAA